MCSSVIGSSIDWFTQRYFWRRTSARPSQGASVSLRVRTRGDVRVGQKPRPSTVYQIFQHRCHSQSCGGQIKDLTAGEKNVRSDVSSDRETLAPSARPRWVAFGLREEAPRESLVTPFASPSRLTANYIIRFLSIVKRAEIPQGGCDMVYVTFFSIWSFRCTHHGQNCEGLS